MQNRQRCFLGICFVSTVLVVFTLYATRGDFQHFVHKAVNAVNSYGILRINTGDDVLLLLSETKVEIFPTWTTQDPHDTTFIRRVYLYSAIIDIHNSTVNETNVNFPAFQDGYFFSSLTCCAKLAGKAKEHRGSTMEIDYTGKKILPDRKLSRTLTFIGAVFRCHFPFSATELRGALVTMTTAACPVNVTQYLVVHDPVRKPGGLAACAKVAFGHHLDPYKLVEWIEVQKLLGVDTIQLFEHNNTQLVYRIFRHYQQSGVLNLLPFTLPGIPWGRNFLAGNNDWTRMNDETELLIWDCRLRLAGYDYVMDIDMDEIIMPQKITRLKPLFKELFNDSEVAGVHFRPQFFIEEWGPVNKAAPLLFLQFLNSTVTHRTGKDVYMPSRTHQAQTHNSFPYKGYKRIFADTAVAVVHHYRKWKEIWTWRPDTTVIDHHMERLQADLVPNVIAVRKKMGMKWTK